MKYNDKSNDSFNARLRFYYFSCVLKDDLAIDRDEFIQFDIDKGDALEYVNLYIGQYQQYEKEYVIEDQKGAKSNAVIYDELQQLIKSKKAETDSWREYYRGEVFKHKLSKDQFKVFEKIKNCFYCGTSLAQIDDLASQDLLFKKTERGFSLELDRKSPNMEYSNDNCVMACYWCNNAKTDEFSAEEFAPIGKAIGEVFKQRLIKK